MTVRLSDEGRVGPARLIASREDPVQAPRLALERLLDGGIDLRVGRTPLLPPRIETRSSFADSWTSLHELGGAETVVAVVAAGLLSTVTRTR